MSVFSFIEVIEEKNRYSQTSDNNELVLSFGQGFGWWNLIAVAGGSYLYQGSASTNDPALMQDAEIMAKLFYEQKLTATLKNYRIAIKACEQALNVGIEVLEAKFKEDLGLLQDSYEWFLNAYGKLPSGIVRIDWAEGVWGQSDKRLYEMSKYPTQILNYYKGLASDTTMLLAHKLTEEAFIHEYQDKQELTI